VFVPNHEVDFHQTSMVVFYLDNLPEDWFTVFRLGQLSAWLFTVKPVLKDHI